MIHVGDCIEVMRGMETDTFHACVTDPPYGLEFMGKSWDRFEAPKTTTERADHMNRSNSYGPWGRRDRPINPNICGHRNERCLKCGRWRVSSNRCKCANPEWEYRTRQEAPVAMLAFQASMAEWAREAHRVLRPGAHLVAFGGTRTFHRMACAIEDAGFEIRDTLMWVYGSGFNKVGMIRNRHPEQWCKCDDQTSQHTGTLDDGTLRDGGCCPRCGGISQDFNGFGGSLKPAWEPIILARKPLDGTVAANLAKWGCGALNVDGCRVDARARPLVTSHRRLEHNVYSSGLGGSRAAGSTTEGRWPANLVHDGSDEVVGAFPESAGQQGDVRGDEPSGVTKDIYGKFSGRVPSAARSDKAGSAARFFYCAKASKADRNDGLDGLEIVSVCLEKQDGAGNWESEASLATLRVDTGQSPPKVIAASGALGKSATEWSTLLFGSAHMAPSPLDTTSTTETVIKSTIGLTTLSYFQRWLTSERTGDVSCDQTAGGSRVETAASGAMSITTTSGGMALALGVDAVPSTTRFKISVTAARSDHPTVKPTELMRWLVRLVTPPGGHVLDPFMGSGSTGRGCALEGMAFTGIEQDAAYADIARRRIEAARPAPDLFSEAAE